MRYFAGAMLLLGLVAACGQTPNNGGTAIDVVKNGDFTEQDVRLRDGRVVPCLFWGSGQGSQTAIGGMSCDWSRAK